MGKSILALSILFLLLNSCKAPYREKHADYFDLSKQLRFLESNITNSNDNQLMVKIIFWHYAQFHLSSDLEIKRDSVKIRTLTKTYLNQLIDTTFTISKDEIIKEFEFQKDNAKDIVVLAGNYQQIKIKRAEQQISYPPTRVGKYLIDFLQSGKTNFN